MARNKKTNWFEIVEIIIFIISLIITLLSLPLVLNNKINCATDTATNYQLITSLACNYGVKGILFFVVLIILFLSLIALINKSSQK
jgi:uncharacterized membrane protein YtjA (UPF0391 family)